MAQTISLANILQPDKIKVIGKAYNTIQYDLPISYIDYHDGTHITIMVDLVKGILDPNYSECVQ